MSQSEPIELHLQPEPYGYPVRFEPLSDLPSLMDEVGLDADRAVLATDETVWDLYGRELEEQLRDSGRSVVSLRLPPGEPTKSSEHLSLIYDRALDAGLDRSTPVLALGGGVIGDLAGFAAATLLRGLPLVQIPTTLIGQADSAIGGKTAINHRTGKNLIGAFHQPELVLADPTTLQTLPDREWTSGLAEVLKYAFIQDGELYAYLRTEWEAVVDRDPEAVEEIVSRSARVKVNVVQRDVHEAGIRSFLNFGHTIGHAIERASGYGVFTHGEAVALGMVAALYLSDLHHSDIPLEESVDLVLRLPVPEPPESLEFDDLWPVMKQDKKTTDGRVRFVLLRTLGDPELSAAVSRSEVAEAWRFAEDRLKQARPPGRRGTKRGSGR